MQRSMQIVTKMDREVSGERQTDRQTGREVDKKSVRSVDN